MWKKTKKEIPALEIVAPKPAEIREAIVNPKIEEESNWAVVQIPTATTPQLLNGATGQQMDIYEALSYILNTQEELLKRTED